MELSSKDVARLRSQAHDLDVTVQVGKAGLTEGVVDEAREQLEREKLVKVKLLRSARANREREELAQALADRADAHLVEVRGNTAVLYRP